MLRCWCYQKREKNKENGMGWETGEKRQIKVKKKEEKDGRSGKVVRERRVIQDQKKWRCSFGWLSSRGSSRSRTLLQTGKGGHGLVGDVALSASSSDRGLGHDECPSAAQVLDHVVHHVATIGLGSCRALLTIRTLGSGFGSLFFFFPIRIGKKKMRRVKRRRQYHLKTSLLGQGSLLSKSLAALVLDLGFLLMRKKKEGQRGETTKEKEEEEEEERKRNKPQSQRRTCG